MNEPVIEKDLNDLFMNTSRTVVYTSLLLQGGSEKNQDNELEGHMLV